MTVDLFTAYAPCRSALFTAARGKKTVLDVKTGAAQFIDDASRDRVASRSRRDDSVFQLSGFGVKVERGAGGANLEFRIYQANVAESTSFLTFSLVAKLFSGQQGWASSKSRVLAHYEGVSLGVVDERGS